MLRKIYYILILCVLCSSCEFKLKSNDDDDDPSNMKVERYDRLESRYVITGDFSALQQMNTEYPIETRTLVEKILRIGDVSDHDISERFLRFYQDSTLQSLVSDVELEYANMDDISDGLRNTFTKLKKWIPDLPLPHVYTQIGALDQSIVVGDRTIGISLDKYMGAKYPIYEKFGYSNEQLESMNRSYIVPDCTLFYLLSLYPMKKLRHEVSTGERPAHGKADVGNQQGNRHGALPHRLCANGERIHEEAWRHNHKATLGKRRIQRHEIIM